MGAAISDWLNMSGGVKSAPTITEKRSAYFHQLINFAAVKRPSLERIRTQIGISNTIPKAMSIFVAKSKVDPHGEDRPKLGRGVAQEKFKGYGKDDKVGEEYA